MGSSQFSEGLPLENGTDLLILLLYAPGKKNHEAEPVDGITRLQKLMFLLGRDVSPGRMVDIAKSYGYKPYKMGPYSDGLISDINDLTAAGIIKTERLEYWIPDDSDESGDGVDIDVPARRTKKVESMRYSLSNPLGLQIGKDLWAALGLVDRKNLAKFKCFFNNLSLRELLIFAYERFPEYTTASTIKSQLGL